MDSVSGLPLRYGTDAQTASTVGWFSTTAATPGPPCLFCNQPALWWKPVGWIRKLWWCPPCETTWMT